MKAWSKRTLWSMHQLQPVVLWSCNRLFHVIFILFMDQTLIVFFLNFFCKSIFKISRKLLDRFRLNFAHLFFLNEGWKKGHFFGKNHKITWKIQHFFNSFVQIQDNLMYLRNLLGFLISDEQWIILTSGWELFWSDYQWLNCQYFCSKISPNILKIMLNNVYKLKNINKRLISTKYMETFKKMSFFFLPLKGLCSYSWI